MELKDLIGLHTLSGVDFDKTEIKTWGDEFQIAQCIRFVLDGICYIAVEDPNDGYRSTMREIKISETPCKDLFAPVQVWGYMKSKGNETIVFESKKNHQVVLEVGTDNINDYYPWYVATFNPQHL